MNKSVYSLMLFDEIVEKIDQLAHINNTNRSQLINDILAEHIGLRTPEQKIQQILEQLDKNFHGMLAVSQITKNSSIQFGKSLKYKYRPKVRYSYEFVNDSSQKYAVLKVSSRTKSEDLNDYFDDFFNRIEIIEKNAKVLSKNDELNQTNHKFVRTFKKESEVSKDTNEISQFLTNYLKMLDEAMNIYFSADNIDNDNGKIDKQLELVYRHFFKNN